MKRSITIVAVLISTLTACASTPRTYTYWAKEGVSNQAVKDKIGHCRVEVGADKLSDEQAKKMLAYCMKADGFILKTGQR